MQSWFNIPKICQCNPPHSRLKKNTYWLMKKGIWQNSIFVHGKKNLLNREELLQLDKEHCVWFFVTPWTVAHKAPLSTGILQTPPAMRETWVSMTSSRGSSQPKDQTQVSHITSGFFTSWATRESKNQKGRDKTSLTQDMILDIKNSKSESSQKTQLSFHIYFPILATSFTISTKKSLE